MQFNSYQEKALGTDLSNPLDYYFLGLVEESGEVAGLRKRFLRGDYGVDYDKLEKELGDVLWYVSMIANRYNISLDDIATTNIRKLQSRKERNVIKGSGSER
jgi:NTP pyrophosphatase (non-canonical NTP hydrolase)